MKIEPCKYCNEPPLVVDDGGNNEHYEIACSNIHCKNDLIVSDKDKNKAINNWNIENS